MGTLTLTANGSRDYEAATAQEAEETARPVRMIGHAKNWLYTHGFTLEIVACVVIGCVSILSLANGTKEMATRLERLELSVQQAVIDRAEILGSQRRIEAAIRDLEKAIPTK